MKVWTPEEAPLLPSAAEMREWDKAAINFGLPEIMLMENAGRQACQLLLEEAKPLSAPAVCLFMGSGNNGGDAACMARHLRDAGFLPVVFHLKALDKLGEAAAWHVKLARAAGVIFEPLPADISPCSILARFRALTGNFPCVLVDGILGTGFHGSLRPDLTSLVESVNGLARQAAFLLALDIPSGLNADSGTPSPVAVRASATVTFAAAKRGMVLPCAREFTGALFERPISIPAVLKASLPASFRLLDGRALLIPPEKPAASYKNIYGHALVIGGAKGYSGAAHLASAAAIRTGAGLVTACAPAPSLPLIKNGWPEIMTLPASENSGTAWPDRISEPLKEAIKGASVLIIGPGMGRTKDSGRFLASLLAPGEAPPMILDADALMLIAKNRELAARLRPVDILTPHPGEAAALLGIKPKDAQADRFAALESLKDFSPAAVVLKGAGTLVGQRDLPSFICPYDIPQMAIGGAGDVLSGCIGALRGLEAGSGYSALASACLGVARHAMAGLIMAARFPDRGARASDLADALAEAPACIAARYKEKPDRGLVPWP